jgi:NADPH:quinone reductase-like Zn-dependent oxidoreductase
MKAIVYRRYGSSDVLEYEETDKPTVGDDQVLIKVRAASVNPFDWHFMRGTPYFLRIQTGLRKPKETRLGVDVAGQVEAVGRNVTRFRTGDEVFGSCRGAFAEYACASESALVMKPDNITPEQAAAVPMAAYTALQGLRDKGQLQPGQKVLVNGASGGVGTFAVQIAKALGADVAGVCSTRNVDIVRSLGADRVIDYTQEDFTRSGQRYDLIFDCAANRSLSAVRRALNPTGKYIMVGGPTGRWMIGLLARAIAGLLWSRFVSETMIIFTAKRSQQDLTTICELIKAGKVTPVIDKRFRLSEVPAAARYLEQGHARGKVIISVESDHRTAD